MVPSRPKACYLGLLCDPIALGNHSGIAVESPSQAKEGFRPVDKLLL
jgi:hypothetical protein